MRILKAAVPFVSLLSFFRKGKAIRRKSYCSAHKSANVRSRGPRRYTGDISSRKYLSSNEGCSSRFPASAEFPPASTRTAFHRTDPEWPALSLSRSSFQRINQAEELSQSKKGILFFYCFVQLHCMDSGDTR